MPVRDAFATTLLAAILAAPAAAQAAEAETPEAPAEAEPAAGMSVADRFGGTFLYENAFSIGHGGDLAPEASRVYSMSWIFTPTFSFTEDLSTSLKIPLTEELTEGGDTFDDELVVGNFVWSLDAGLPKPPVKALSGGVGVALELPTSKVSRAESLVMGVGPYFTGTVTAPVVDGISLSWTVAPSPRIQRYTTWSNLTPRPCSPAAGCTFGVAGTTDTGYRNTAFQLVQDFHVGVAAVDERLYVGATFQTVHGKLHPKSPSPRFDEATLSPASNLGGDPWTLSYSLVFDVSFQVHPFLGVSVGAWTPGGMRPDGGWYLPLGNRFTQIYIDVTLSPAALAQ